MVTPIFRFDPVDMPAETITLRTEVRAFIKEHEHPMGFTRIEFNLDFRRAMENRLD